MKPAGSLVPNRFVAYVQVSSWDSIFGPIIEMIWASEKGDVDPALAKYVARQTLDGEIYRTESDAEMEIKFHHVPSFDLILTSIVFSANPRGDGTKFSIALLIRGHNLATALRLHLVLEDRLLFLATQLQALLNTV